MNICSFCGVCELLFVSRILAGLRGNKASHSTPAPKTRQLATPGNHSRDCNKFRTLAQCLCPERLFVPAQAVIVLACLFPIKHVCMSMMVAAHACHVGIQSHSFMVLGCLLCECRGCVHDLCIRIHSLLLRLKAVLGQLNPTSMLLNPGHDASVIRGINEGG